MPVNILHLAYTRFPADTRVKRETAVLTARRHRVATVVLRDPGERAVERCNGVLVVRVPGRKSRGGVLSYLLEYGEFVWRCRRLVATHRALARVRVVHVHTLPDFLLWAALPARRRGALIVLDMHEIFPEFIRSKFKGAFGRLAGWFADRVERWARRRANLTITVNRPIDTLLAGRPIGRPERRIVLHNTADPADFGDTTTVPLAGGPPEFIYHGTLTGLYGLDIAIRAVALARQSGLDVRLTILGDGPERDALRQLVQKQGVADVVAFEDPIAQRALPARLGRAVAGVVPTRLDGMTRYSLSTKLLEYVHLGIPVLAARLPSYEAYLDDATVWYWRPGDPADLCRAIRELIAASPGLRDERAGAARLAIEPLAWSKEKHVLERAYDELLTGGNRALNTSAIRSAAVPSP